MTMNVPSMRASNPAEAEASMRGRELSALSPNSWKRLSSIIFVAVMLSLASCGWRDTAEIRYRITIEVDTPTGLRSGSSVWSFRLRPGGLTSAHNSEFKGEAIAVDIREGRTLYALLVGGGIDGDRVYHGVPAMLPENLHRRMGLTRQFEREVLGDRVRVLRYIRGLPRRRLALDCGASHEYECLLLVQFRDPADPATIEAVPYGRLSQAFGPGVRVRAVYLEVTDDRPSFDLQDRLRWLDDRSETRLRRTHHGQQPSLANYLSYGEFQRR